MGIGQIQAGKAYVSIYGDNSPLVQMMRDELAPEIRKQSSMLAKIGSQATLDFSKANSAIAATTNRANSAEASLQMMRTAANSVSQAAQLAMIKTANSSRTTVDGVTKIVDKMDRAAPAAKGFAAAFAGLSSANVGLASGAFGVSTLLGLLKSAGPAAQPLLDALNGIAGASGRVSAVKSILPSLPPASAVKSASSSSAMNMSLLSSSPIPATPATPTGGIGRAAKSVSSGAMAAMGGLQPMFEMIKGGASDALTRLKASETALFALGLAGGVVKGSLDGTFKTLVNGSKLAAVIGVNIAGGMAGVRGAFAPVLGQMTALQKAANSAQWATLFVGSKQQRKIAKQMGLEADAAAIGEAFPRGWVPGFAKYVKIGVPRAIFSGVRGAASLPGMAIGGAISLFKGRGQSNAVEQTGKKASSAVPGVNLLTGALEKANRVAAKGTSIFGSLGRAAGSLVGAGLGAIGGIAAMAANHAEGASSKVTSIGASSTDQGRSAKSTSQLSYGAEATGSSLKTLDSAMDHLKGTIKSANDGSEKASDSLNKFGLSAQTLASLSVDDRMKKLGEALNRIKDPADRDRAAIELLGESGAELVPLLADIQGYRDKAQSSGTMIDEKDVEASKKMQLAMSQLKATLSNAWTSIGAASIRSTTEWIDGATKFVQKNQAIIDTFTKIGAGIVSAAGAFVLWEKYGSRVMPVVKGLAMAVGLLTSPVGLVVAGVGAGVAAWMYFTDSGRQSATFLGGLFKRFGEFFGEVWGGIVGALKKGDLALAGNIAFKGLQLGFLQVVQGMGISWTDTMSVLYGAAAGLSEGMSNVWAGVSTGFRNFQNFLAKGMVALTGGIGKMWAQVFSSIVKGFNNTHNIIGKGMLYVAGKATGRSDEDMKSDMQGMDQQTNHFNDQAEQSRQAALGPELTGTMADLDRMAKVDTDKIENDRRQAIADHQSLMQNRTAALKPDNTRISDSRAELDALLQQARQIETSPAGKPADIGVPEKGSSGDEKTKASVAGTFSATAAVGLGGSGPMDKIEKHTAQTNVLLEKISSAKSKFGKFGGGAKG